ncbi:MAG: hypothetical protein ACYSWW_11230 [Planctomycetota bacterium]|jgi:hypothetical protein
MNTPDFSNGPVFDSGYMPYFYQSGKFLSYDIPHRVPKSAYFSTSTGYDFTSDIVPNTSRPRGPTVEDIINNGYFPIPKSEPETAIISDRKQTSGLGLGGIIGQVRQRYEIYERNIYQIELGKCYTISSQLAVESSRGGVCMSSKEAYSLNKNLQELYQQQRDERVRLWQDISRLKQSLPEQAQQYLSAYRKVSILEDDKGDKL